MRIRLTFFDNGSVVMDSIRPYPILTTRKPQAIVYRRTCKAQAAAGMVQIAKDGRDETNLVDIFTMLLEGPKLQDLSQCIQW